MCEGVRFAREQPGLPPSAYCTDGVPGAEYTDTRGNNVFAQEDWDNNNLGGFRPSGGGALEFDFPLNLSTHPTTEKRIEMFDKAADSKHCAEPA